jgi:hypothetical protein
LVIWLTRSSPDGCGCGGRGFAGFLTKTGEFIFFGGMGGGRGISRNERKLPENQGF